MKLVGIKYKETEFEGKKYPKYECHLLDNRRLPQMTGATCVVYDVPLRVLEDDFTFVINGEYDFVFDDGKVIAVFDITPQSIEKADNNKK